MRRGRRWLLSSFGLEGDAQEYLTHARAYSGRGDLRLAATAYDRAYGLAPDDAAITAVSEGVRGFALDATTAAALWKKSEEMVGETF